jgi:hypothetical protein
VGLIILNDKETKVMATLELISLYCHRKQDVSGKDEPRLKVDGDVIWNGVMEKGSDRNLRDTSVPFEDSTKVKLEEMNGDKPKQIGAEATIRESGNPDSVQFKTSGAWYELFFEVS